MSHLKSNHVENYAFPLHSAPTYRLCAVLLNSLWIRISSLQRFKDIFEQFFIKGQLISERNFDVFKSPRKEKQSLDRFLPYVASASSFRDNFLLLSKGSKNKRKWVILVNFYQNPFKSLPAQVGRLYGSKAAQIYLILISIPFNLEDLGVSETCSNCKSQFMYNAAINMHCAPGLHAVNIVEVRL